MQKWRKSQEEGRVLYLLDMNTNLFPLFLMIIIALYVTYLYENQFKQDVVTDSVRTVLMKRSEGTNYQKQIRSDSLEFC